MVAVSCLIARQASSPVRLQGPTVIARQGSPSALPGEVRAILRARTECGFGTGSSGPEPARLSFRASQKGRRGRESGWMRHVSPCLFELGARGGAARDYVFSPVARALVRHAVLRAKGMAGQGEGADPGETRVPPMGLAGRIFHKPWIETTFLSIRPLTLRGYIAIKRATGFTASRLLRTSGPFIWDPQRGNGGGGVFLFGDPVSFLANGCDKRRSARVVKGGGL